MSFVEVGATSGAQPPKGVLDRLDGATRIDRSRAALAECAAGLSEPGLAPAKAEALYVAMPLLLLLLPPLTNNKLLYLTHPASLRYRRSALTYLMHDSLGCGGARAVWLACASPTLADSGDAFATLKLLDRLRRLCTDPSRSGSAQVDHDDLDVEIEQLEALLEAGKNDARRLPRGLKVAGLAAQVDALKSLRTQGERAMNKRSVSEGGVRGVWRRGVVASWRRGVVAS